MNVRNTLGYACLCLVAAACGGASPATEGDGGSGKSGADGKSSLVKIVAEPVGAHCASGGSAIQSGLDANGNGQLDAGEVSATAYVCNGTSGSGGAGHNSLVKLVAEPAGSNCSTGGTAVKAGIDLNDNGTLEDAEVTSTSYVCKGATGANGANGTNGSNGNNGNNGGVSLVKQVAEAAGANCANGGTAVKSGVDANGNGTLDDAEVSSTTYVCNGAQGGPGDAGPTGAPGLQALVSLATEPAGTNCANGGTVVKSGLDTNSNGTLDAAEVTQTQYVCSATSLYPTKWAVSQPGAFNSNYPVTGWMPAGRTVTLYKQSASTRLKLTINDNFRVGYPNSTANINGGNGYYAVKLNGGPWIAGCYLGEYTWNASGWNNNFHMPLGNVCMTDALPAGLYTFDAWVYSASGDAYVGNDSTVSLLVEETDAATVATALGSAEWSTMSTTYTQVPGRTATYTKKAANTLLKVTLSDDLRVGYNQNGGWGSVMIRQDGLDTPCYFSSFDAPGTGSGSDLHLPVATTCLLENVAAGSHAYTVWASANTATTGNTGQLYMGWGRGTTGTLLVVEEVPNTKLAYKVINNSVATPTATAELSSQAYSAVPGRQVSFTPSAAGKTVKVTYADTFRNNLGCNGGWGSMQLYMDGAPTGCVMGKYTWTSGGANQDHHEPVLMTCLVPNVSQASHIFEIWHRTTSSGGTNASACGTNYFGWTRGQVLLLVEELP